MPQHQLPATSPVHVEDAAIARPSLVDSIAIRASSAWAWTNVGLRTVSYGLLSCTVGAVTPGNGVSRWAMRKWCINTCRAAAIDRELFFGERLIATDQCVYVSNHESLLDILVLGSFLDNDYRWLAKSSVFKVPFLGWHLSLTGHVSVQRGEGRDNSSLPARIHKVVDEGASLLFFPEGTRSRDGRLQRFKIGAFSAAVREGLPVVPLVLRGTGSVLTKGRVELNQVRRRATSVTVLPPIAPPSGGDDNARARLLRDRVRAAMRDELSVAR